MATRRERSDRRGGSNKKATRQNGDVTLLTIGNLGSLPATDHPELLAPAVAAALADWEHASEVAVVEIDPASLTPKPSARPTTFRWKDPSTVSWSGDPAGRAAHRGVHGPGRQASRREQRDPAASRRAQGFVPAMDQAVSDSGMEYGGITPVGIPEDWRLLVDSRCVDVDTVVIGSGVRRSKLVLPGRLLGLCQGRRSSRTWLARFTPMMNPAVPLSLARIGIGATARCARPGLPGLPARPEAEPAAPFITRIFGSREIALGVATLASLRAGNKAG